MLTLFAFIVALALLIAIHEYGHYRMAVACGVKVLRFSLGIGKPLLRWKARHSDTEFVLAALPLGGYVRMLDEREGDVPQAQLNQCFNRQSLPKRAAIVAAGPAANLLLAAVLYSVVNWWGMEQPKAIVAAPESQTLAAQAGLKGGEEVLSLQWGAGGLVQVSSFEDLRWQITQAALHGQDVTLNWVAKTTGATGQSLLKLSTINSAEMDQEILDQIGLVGPWSDPVVGALMPDKPAHQAGLQQGDRVLAVNDVAVVDAAQLRAWIRRAGVDGTGGAQQQWLIQRGQDKLVLTVIPELTVLDGKQIGRVGAYIGAPTATVKVQKGFVAGLSDGVAKTWEMSVLSIQMMAKMLIGQASLQNLSGPLTIADYAGKSASLGVVQYILFLAIVSVSLGVLNLLPLPVLDGGHLMYYLWEGVTGHPVSDAWMEYLQRIGIALLLVMMSIALFNDIGRIWG